VESHHFVCNLKIHMLHDSSSAPHSAGRA
jgi:hypothetical protein